MSDILKVCYTSYTHNAFGVGQTQKIMKATLSLAPNNYIPLIIDQLVRNTYVVQVFEHFDLPNSLFTKAKVHVYICN